MNLRPISFGTQPLPAAAPAVPPPDEPGSDELAPFRRLGSPDEMGWVQERLSEEKGPLRDLSRRDRGRVLLALLKAHSGPTLAERFPERQLSQIRSELGRFTDEHAKLAVGDSETDLPLGQPDKQTPFKTAVYDYLGHLSRVGSPEKAVDCMRVELCHLYSDPPKLQSFRMLLERFRDPGVALVVLRQYQSVPAERRADFLAGVERDLSDFTHTEAVAARHGLVHRVARLEDSVESLLAELERLSGDEDRLEQAAAWRGPGQSWEQGLANLPPGNLWKQASCRLGEAIHARSVRSGESHSDWLGKIAPLADRLGAWLPLNRMVECLEGDAPFDPEAVLLQTERETELAGLRGFTSVRQSVRQALLEGSLRGDFEQLMKRFELIFLQRRGEPNALDASLQELLQVAEPPTSGVTETSAAVWVGGVRVRKAGA